MKRFLRTHLVLAVQAVVSMPVLAVNPDKSIRVTVPSAFDGVSEVLMHALALQQMECLS